MRRAALVALLAAGLLGGGCATTPQTTEPAAASPLLAMAESRHYLEPLGHARHEAAIFAAQAMLASYAERAEAGLCTDAACEDGRIATTREFGLAYSRLGLHRLALAIYQAILEQRADESTSYVDVAAEQMLLGRTEDAARSYAKALQLAKGTDSSVLEYAAMFALLTGDTATARERFEACVRLGKPAGTVQYCAIGLAATKTRGGNDSLLATVTPTSAWPGALLAHLRGQIDEAELARQIALVADTDTQREQLSEAVYYVGERHLARGDRALALRCFRANQALRVESFFETEAAARRIRELGGNDDPSRD